jgi:hypothetical protein
MKTNIALALTAFVSASIGTAAGYLYAEKRSKRLFEDRLAQEVEEAREHYAMKYKEGPFATPEGALEALAQRTPGAELTDEDRAIAEKGRGSAKKVSGGQRQDVTAEDLDRMVHGLKYGPEGGFEHRRDPQHVEVITEEEYYKEETGYEQVSWVFYAADGVVTDASDKQIEDFERVLGYSWINKFGIDTRDPNTVHVRNTQRGLEIEIVRSMGSYQYEVLGIRE